MNSYTKLPKNKLYGILGSCAFIIMIASLEVLTIVKDIQFYNEWVQLIGNELAADFNTYVGLQISLYFSKIILPMSLSLYALLAYSKIRINSLFVFMWSVLSLGSLAYSLMGFNFYSVFFYGFIIGYFVLLITILSLTKEISESKFK